MIKRTLLLCLACLATAAHADVADPDPGRFAEEIAAFAAWDSKNAAPADPILFVGSSSIRLWSTAEAFPGYPVINRGFGGSELSDAIHFYDVLVKPFSPAKIFLYEGDNDIERGKSAEQVLEDFKQFADMVAADFPGTELVFLSIKPSTARWDKWPVMREANRMVREHAERQPNLAYADVATPLLDASGGPGDFFVADGLHLNERGYALWREAIAPYLATAARDL